jgi:hypothetical protein
MLFKVGRIVRTTVKLVKEEIAGLTDNSGLRCANLRMRRASVESNTVLPVRSASSTMEGNPGIPRPARTVKVLFLYFQHHICSRLQLDRAKPWCPLDF